MKIFILTLFTLALSSCMKAPIKTQKVSINNQTIEKKAPQKHTRGISSIEINLSLEDEIDLQAKQLENSLK